MALAATTPCPKPPAPPPCNKADGSGSVKGKGDNASFSFHHHECDNGTEKRENLSDHGVGINFQFHAGHERDFDGMTGTVTTLGLGADNGFPSRSLWWPRTAYW